MLHSLIYYHGIAGLAQSVERIHGKDEVAGSIPATSILTMKALVLQGFLIFLSPICLNVYFG